MKKLPPLLLAGLAVVLATACATESNPTTPALTAALDHSNTVPEVQELTICKHGSAADFDVNGTMYSLGDGDCELVISTPLGMPVDVTITETSAEPGYMFDRTETASKVGLMFPPPVEGFDPSVMLRVGDDQGHVLTFFNVPVPGGGEGCTPGYWKQPHHFDSWVGYDPDDAFSSVFEDAFPGMTLLEVLGQGGGGLNALGRHTVAALLNSATGGVSYDLTTQEVIDAFNAVYPGSNSDYNALKDQFEGFNEQGCPLN